MSLISQGLAKNLIKLDDEQKYITYVHQNKKRNFTNPEEKVQAEAFLKLILTYGYDQKRIRLFVPVTIGSTTKEADIIVYNDDELTSAHIVVECKKEEVSENEFIQAVSQAFSYAATGTVRAKYFWVTSNIKDVYSEIPEKEPKKYQAIPDIPQYGVNELPKYKYAKGGGVSGKQKLFDLEVVTEDELTRCFKQAHQSLWGGGELNPSSAFDELDKLIFCKIWDEKKARKQGEPYDFQIFSVVPKPKEKEEDRLKRENKELSDRVKALYEEGRLKDTEVFKDDIRLNPEKLRTVVEYLQKLNLSDTDLDCKGRAFETFMGSFFRGDFGQYFTPRPIVKFIVDTLPINHNSLVLDTSCGSGGFLLHALDKVRGEANEYYPNYATNPKEFNQHYKHWHDFAEHNLFGIEINEQIARVAKMNMIIHDDGHTNVIASDGLRDSKELIERSGNKGFAYNRFNLIITNPPFGSVIKQTEQAYMHQYGFAMKAEDWLNPKSKPALRDNQNTEILFIEQCHNFLVDGGYLAMVVPDGILTNSSLQYVRDGIEDKYRIVAVVSMPQTAFQATGAGVKSSVLFLKKYSQAMTEKIQNQKVRLQDDIKKSNDYLQQLEQIERDKKKHLKDLTGFENPQNLSGKALTDSEAYKEWRKEVTAEYNDRIDALKESLSEQYAEEKQKSLGDYPIFMAIAEDIGYDATGKPTNNNELDFIGVELARFIEAIEKGDDSFFLSLDVDRNKIFLIHLSNCIFRLDPYYYKPDFLSLREKLENNPLFQTVGSLIKSWNRGDGPRDGFYTDDIQNGVYFLRVNNLKNHTIDIDDVKYITRYVHENTLKRAQVTAGDLVFAISGTKENLGTVSIVPNNILEANLNSALVRLELNWSIIDKRYFCYMFDLNTTRIQIDFIGKGAAQNNLNNEEISQIHIFIPSISKQEKIVNYLDEAHLKKKQKETEAQRSLESIDDYLLSELDIHLPEPEQNTIQNRIFYRNLNEVIGGRFDPSFYKPKYTSLMNSIKIFPHDKLGHIVRFSNETWDQKSIFNETFPYIEIGEIDTSLGEICNISELKIEDAPSRAKMIIRGGDILVSTTRPNRGAIVEIEQSENKFIASTGFSVIREVVKHNINKRFLFYILRQSISLQQMEQRSSGGNYPAITQEELQNILIPLPPLEKQIEIVDRITTIRDRAKQLRQEAEVELEKAKQEVEAMILGVE